MDGAQFDQWTRVPTRRDATRLTGTAVGAAAIGAVTGGEASAGGRCKGGKKRCKGKCVNTRRDPKSCGKCNKKCTSTERCQNGVCTSNLTCGEGGDCIVFISSQTTTGNMGGRIGANTFCQTLAANAGLPGTYVAWLADESGTPATYFNQTLGPFVRIDGDPIADDFAQLTSGQLRGTIVRDEYEEVVEERVWTNVSADGKLFSATATCDNWQSGSVAAGGGYGLSDASNSEWTVNAAELAEPCNAEHHLYCFQQM